MGAEQSLQQKGLGGPGSEQVEGDAGGAVVQARILGTATRDRYHAAAMYGDEFVGERHGGGSIFTDNSRTGNALHAQSQVIPGIDNTMQSSHVVEGNRTTKGLESQRSSNQRDKFNNIVTASGREPGSKLGGSASRKELPARQKIFGGAGNLNSKNQQRSTRVNVNGTAQGSHISGFNSQNSKRLGPNFGSGAYSQKQKVGVLEQTNQTVDHVAGKNSDKQSQGASRKSAGAFSIYKSNQLARPGFANKPSKDKGYDQFQGKTTNVLEEMSFVVLSDNRSAKILQYKQLQGLTNNFEESLKQVIYERQRGPGDSQILSNQGTDNL